MTINIVAIVEDDRGRWEEKYNDVPVDSPAEAKEWMQLVIDSWNRTLRPIELPRRLIDVTVEEIA